MASHRRINIHIFVSLIFILVTVDCQQHSTYGTPCYTCSRSHDRYAFPSCLEKGVEYCAAGQECRVAYEPPGSTTSSTISWSSYLHQPVIGCYSSCSFHSAASSDCPLGGINTGNRCEMCCKTQDCIDKVAAGLKTGFNVFCPGKCDVWNFADCISSGRACAADEFCRVDLMNKDEVVGDCVPILNEYSKCTETKLKQPCSIDGGSYNDDINGCVMDCCKTNDCLRNHFGKISATVATATSAPVSARSSLPASPTTKTTTPRPITTTPSSTVASTPPTKYGHLLQECRDHLEAGVCKNLKDAQNFCDPQSSEVNLHLDLCPETCGACQAIEEVNCHDTVLDGECARLVSSKNVCSEAVAIYTCPVTCGLCDTLIDKKLQEVVANLNSPSTFATQPLPPTTTEMYDCQEVLATDCSYAIAMCSDPSIYQQCTTECNECDDVNSNSMTTTVAA